MEHGKSYRGVEAVISFHVSILSGSMVGLSESDARHAACDRTCVDGHEAAKQRLCPWAGVWCGIASDDRRIGKSLVESFDPVVHIILVDDWFWGLGVFCHCFCEVDELSKGVTGVRKGVTMLMARIRWNVGNAGTSSDFLREIILRYMYRACPNYPPPSTCVPRIATGVEVLIEI